MNDSRYDSEVIRSFKDNRLPLMENESSTDGIQYDPEVAITKIGKVVKQKIRPRTNPAPTRRSRATP
jgi:hypothetical protein